MFCRTVCTVVAPVLSILLAEFVHGQCEFTIIAPDERSVVVQPGDGDSWHERIAVDGEWMALNADADYSGLSFGPDDHVSEASSVLIFRHVDGAWVQDALLRDPEMNFEQRSSGFGEAFDFSGDRIAIAARNPNPGVLYIYSRDENSWVVSAEIELGNEFVHSGDLEDRLDVEFNDAGILISSATSTGERRIDFYVETAPDTWMKAQSIRGGSGAWPLRFGSSIAVDSNRMVIPSSSLDEQFVLYELIKGTWVSRGAIDVGLDVPSYRAVNVAIHDGTVVAFGKTDGALDDFVSIFEFSEGDGWAATNIEIPFAFAGDIPIGGIGAGGVAFDGTTILLTIRSGEHWRKNEGAMLVLRDDGDGWAITGGIRPATATGCGIPMREYHVGFGSDVALHDGAAYVTGHLRMWRLENEGEGRTTLPCVYRYALDDPFGEDVDGNGICDALDTLRFGDDCDSNGLDDALEIELGIATDCNDNGLIDTIDTDCNSDGIPDDCEPDCNGNGIPDVCESMYRVRPDAASPSLMWRFTTLYDHQLWLRKVVVEPGAEVVSELTAYRGSHLRHDGLEFVIIRDLTPDNDPSDGVVLIREPIDLDDASLLQGVVVEIPELWLGEPGTHVYIGLHVPSARFNDNYITSHGSDLPSGEPHVWIFANSSDPIQFDDLSTSDVAWATDQLTPYFEMHHGPRALCCPESDLNDDGVTDVQDLAAIIAAWGPCDGCAEDLDENGDVGVDDLLIVIRNWGECD